jgi:hypothetical protein
MTKTAEIERLLRAFAERGRWTAEEERKVKVMIGRDDDPLVPRRKPFEIDGDWGEPGTKKYDQKPLHELRLDASEDRPPSSSSLEERVAYLERMNALVWRVIHEIQGKKPPEDPEER